MDAHALPIAIDRVLRSGFFRVADPGASGTFSWSNKGVVFSFVTTAGAENRALPPAVSYPDGQLLVVFARTLVGAVTITGAEVSQVLSSQGDFAVFMVTTANGTHVWKTLESTSGNARALARVANFATTAVGVGTTATLTAAQLVGGYITGNPGGGATYTFDTATNILAALPSPRVGDTFEVIINNLNGTNAITVAADASGTTDGTNMTVAANAIRRLLVQVTNTGTPAYLIMSFT